MVHAELALVDISGKHVAKGQLTYFSVNPYQKRLSILAYPVLSAQDSPPIFMVFALHNGVGFFRQLSINWTLFPFLASLFIQAIHVHGPRCPKPGSTDWTVLPLTCLVALSKPLPPSGLHLPSE